MAIHKQVGRGKLVAVRVVAALTLAISVAGLPLPSFSGPVQVAEAASPDKVPPGQLTRRGISGTVVSVNSSSLTVRTNHGDIVVEISSSTVIHAPPERNVGTEAIMAGAKVAVSLNRSPVEPPASEPEPEADAGDEGTPAAEGGTATSTEETLPSTTAEGGTATSTEETLPSTTAEGGTATSTEETLPTTEEETQPEPVFYVIRSVVATVIVVLPGKATRSHQRAIVDSKATGKLKVIGKNGKVVELDDASGDAFEDGDDVVLITRKKNRDSDEVEIRKSQLSAEITDRLDRLKKNFEEAGKADLVERLQEKEREHKNSDQRRIDETRSNVSPDKVADIDRAKEKKRERELAGPNGGGSQGGGSQGGGSQGGGDSQGGGSQGGGSQGGGSQGGGKKNK